MRIFIIHNLYQQPGGEDVVAKQEADVLRSRGHEVRLLQRSNKAIEGLGRLASALNVLRGIWWPPAVRGTAEEIAAFAPDVVHIHNLWYQFNPALVRMLKAKGIPVVMTLHNYRLLCANAVLLRNNAPCRKCVGRTGLWGVYHRCYRNSYFLSACSFLMARLARSLGVWSTDVDRFICLTDFSRRIFSEAGFPQGKLVVKPNFLAPEPIESANGRTEGPSAIYLARFTPDKGFGFLLKAWKRREETLFLGGTGEFPGAAPNVVHLGQLPRPRALAALQRAWVLVVPALAYETFGLVILEAFRAGTPVLASANGTFDSLIDDGRTGLLFRPGDEADFHSKLDRLFADASLRETLAEAGRKEFEAKFTEGAAYGRLASIYADVRG